MGVGQAGAKKKEAYRKQEMIQWETIEQDIEAYLRSQSQEEWRSAFIPLMEGVVQDQGQRWAARLGMQFDVRNVEAEQWFQDYTMKFAADVSLTTENEVRNVIGQGMAEGWSIGEMSSHLDDVFSYWQDGPASGLITPEEWDWYEQRRPFYRREMIARTETIRASNRGTEEHWKRWAIEGKEWIVAHDDRLCPWCAEMDGQIIGISENFWDQGDTMAINIGDRVARLRLRYEDVSSPPLHPNCRCTIIPWKQEWEEVGVAPPEGLDVWGGAEMPPDLWGEQAWMGRPGQYLGRGWEGTDPAAVDAWLLRGIDSENWRWLRSAETAGPVKHEIATQLAERSGVEYDQVNEFIHQWALSSNDADMRSLAIQQDIAEVFGIDLADWQKEKIREKERELERSIRYLISDRRSIHNREQALNYMQSGYNRPTFAQYFPVMDREDQKKVIRAMYERTQEDLAEAGFGATVRLSRGIGVPREMAEDWAEGDLLDFMGSAAESWSQGDDVAQRFGRSAQDWVGLVLEMDVPVERIIGTARTGFGCLSEGEFVVMGSIPGDEARIARLFG